MTAKAKSYDPDRTGFDGEIKRLLSQVELSWDVEWRRLAALGIADGQDILEPGCGPGFVTRRLAKWLPHVRILGIDSDPRLLSLARENTVGPGFLGRIEFRDGTAEATGLAEGAFDVVLSRYLYQHLPHPVSAAAEALRVLRPGGFHVVIDVDDRLWGLAHPEIAEFYDWHRVRAQAQSARHGDRFRGAGLGRILRDAGYVNIELDVFAYHSDAVGLAAFAPQLDPDQFLPLVSEGRLNADDYARACVLNRWFFASPDPFLLAIGFIARGEKPR